ncbi:MAG TPA: 2OG-Fe dioxygenase family protein [Methylophilaceae bacterium]|nr:2OG-Fe dioxygenase family protein [Methylophilaceae bacterium]
MPRSALYASMTQSGFCFAPSAAMQAWLLAQSVDALGDWERFAASWNDMPLDEYMADGGRYRRRRYATLSAASGNSDVVLEPHQPHYQSLDYNNLNGGIARDFEPILDDIVQGPTMRNVLSFGLQTFSHFMPKAKWHIECHQFRIEAQTGEAGQPTPEGVHRDGVDFVLVMMVKRENISSGTTTMHDLEQKGLDSFTLTQPLDCAIVNDRRCMHGVTPIEPINVNQPAYRDVLVVTFRNVA